MKQSLADGVQLVKQLGLNCSTICLADLSWVSAELLGNEELSYLAVIPARSFQTTYLGVVD